MIDTDSLNETPDDDSRRSMWAKLRRDAQALITSTVLLVIFLAGLLAPLIAPHGPNDASLDAVNAPVGTPGFLLGGDASGQDIFSRLLYSINTSSVSAAIGAGVALIVGVVFGLIGGYRGTRTRAVTEWVFNLLMTFPGLILLIVLMPITGGDYRITMLIFGVLLSPATYRIVRNLVLGVKNELFVDAARVSGLSDFRILGRHVLFVVRGPIIINAAFLMGTAIGVQSGLAFLGVGAKSTPSFGGMIGLGFGNLYTQPLQFIWPSALLGIITASLVLLGNSLRDAYEEVRKQPVKIAPAVIQAEGADDSGDSGGALLSVRGLSISYPNPSGALNEVLTDVSFDIQEGQVVGLVGESGSGKTQSAFAVLGVLPPEATITNGSIRLEGKQLLGMAERQLRGIRGSLVAYIPQEPMSNLDPSYTVGAQLVEGIRSSSATGHREAKLEALSLLARVGIADPERTFSSYPHQISGGMAQRVLIAGAVASKPKLLIADEPTTALDVTVQAEILDLLRDLQKELGMAVLFVTHNFGVVADLCDEVVVMKNGEVVERGATAALFDKPVHEYTKLLLNSIIDESAIRTDSPTPLEAEKGPR
jgi:peptide/nickel transport system permease protein